MKRFFKLFLLVIMTLVLAFSFVACNNDPPPDDDDGTGTETGTGDGTTTDPADPVTIDGKWAAIGANGTVLGIYTNSGTADPNVFYYKNTDYPVYDAYFIEIPAEKNKAVLTMAGNPDPFESPITLASENNYNTTLFYDSSDLDLPQGVNYSETLKLQNNLLYWTTTIAYPGHPETYQLVFKKMADVTADKNADGTEKASSFFYETNANGVTITRYVGINTTIKIPSQIDGKNVTEISNNAFAGNRHLSGVVVPSTITTIGTHAFTNCELKCAIIPSSVATIGKKAFDIYIYSARIYCQASSKPSGWHAEFVNNLSNVQWSKQPILDDKGTLYDIVSGEGVVIGSSEKNVVVSSTINNCPVTKIAEKAFYESNIESVYIPASIKEIGEQAFYWLYNLKTVTFENESQLVSIGANAFYQCSNLEGFDIPAGVTEIGEQAFSGCAKIEQITIPAGIFLIEKFTFAGCSSLTDVNFASGCRIMQIGGFAFADCTSLQSISLPSGLLTIGDFAFKSCPNIESVYIPESVTAIGWEAFNACGATHFYCTAQSKPNGWDSHWCPDASTVTWGYVENTNP